MARLKRLSRSRSLDFFSADFSNTSEIPLLESRVAAGFPSPAEDYLDVKLDLNKHLVKHPAATYYVRVKGHSMKNAGIHDNDLLVVDRSLEPKDKDIAVCVVGGEFTVKRIRKEGKKLFLASENPEFKPIEVREGESFDIWGVVAFVVHKP